ncbi:NAD(P)/FAD-dependent oxidoreductase [Aureimonas mangrovi]|uniref:NAD(P)/FAD-dependent oxidoreductase n=1 Tax=Aureimonas mangrovi TaxID=2758041 RepID=UPI00163D59D7|nr:FAD-binding oxidoreductase [Aureimonas mangrovi]
MRGDPRSHGLWEQSAPPAPPTQALEGEDDVDFVIVGAGYTGLSAALHLAEAGARPVVLDACEIGFGGSGRNVGLVNAGLWLRPDEARDALPAPYGERLIALLGAGPQAVFDLVKRHSIPCEAIQAGTLHCAVGAGGERELAARAAQWRKLGAPVRLLDAAEAAAAIGTRAYGAALLDERAGTIQPLAYVRGLARAAILAGATIHTNSPVTRASEENGRWLIETPRGRLRAGFVLVATNAYSHGPFADVGQELVRLPYFNFATAPLPPERVAEILPGRQGAWDTREILSSFRLDATGRLVFGSVGALRGTGHAIHAAWARRAMTQLFPSLRDTAFESCWFGQIGMTADAVPRLHRPAPNMISFSGYNGRGIAPGTVFGRLAAQFMTGSLAEADMPLPFTPLSRVRLRGAREAYYEVGAQLAHAVGART